MPDASAYRIHRAATPAAFLARAEPWLLAREAEYNLALSLASSLSSGEPHGFGKPLYFATVERAGAVEAFAFRTPPFKLGVSRLPAGAVEPLVKDVAALYASLPAVLGDLGSAMAFGEAWCRLKGGAPKVGRRSRIHQAAAVIPPERPAPGRLIAATEQHLPLIAEWTRGFGEETNMRELDPLVVARNLVRSGGLHLWFDDRPRAMAASAGSTRNGIRVGYVFTPPEYRGLGFASAAVAALTEKLLAGGRMFCFLYTDLANPTSNAIYARLGYQPVCDVVDVELM